MSEGAVTARPAGAAAQSAPRVVPGAPPPPPLTKSQIRKRKKTSAAKSKLGTEETSAGLDVVETPREAALVDHVPSAMVDTLVATSEENKTNHSAVTPAATEKPASPLVELVVNKRIKHFAKKLVCHLLVYMRGVPACPLPTSITATHSHVLIKPARNTQRRPEKCYPDYSSLGGRHQGA